MTSTGAAVFLDRDGTLNESTLRGGIPRPPASIDGLRLLPGVAAACSQLIGAGLTLICITNQPDVARGATPRAVVDALNAELLDRLPLTRILVCPHDDADDCACRKPQPGMLRLGARELGIDLARSVMVGDSWRDVEAGHRAGCATVWIDHGYHAQQQVAADLTVRSLEEAVPWILDFVTVKLRAVPRG